jgi:hypothetical protein
VGQAVSAIPDLDLNGEDGRAGGLGQKGERGGNGGSGGNGANITIGMLEGTLAERIGNSFASVPRNARSCGVFRVGERCFSVTTAHACGC